MTPATDDVLLPRRLALSEIRDVHFGVRPVDMLALWFFLSCHTTAVPARIIVVEVPPR